MSTKKSTAPANTPAPTVSKEDYLKRYLQPVSQTQPEEFKKPKKKKTAVKVKPSQVVIVDHTLNVRPKTQIDEKPEAEDEDAPVVVAEIREKAQRSFAVGVGEDGSGWTVVQDPNAKKNVVDDDEDLSPVRGRRRRHDSDDEDGDDLSPVRRRHDDDDLSPVRPKRRDNDNVVNAPSSEAKKGLVSADEVAREVQAKRRRQNESFDKMNDEDLGKNAKTVFRDKSGKKVSISDIIAKEEEKKKAEQDEQLMEWGRGIVQKREREERKMLEADMINKPFARTEDDEELNQMFKEQDRWGDPMAHLGKKEKKNKKEKKQKKEKKDKKEKKAKSKLRIPKEKRWKGAPPANRYNILPGNAWDGVDRSNGYEKKLLTREGEKMARDEQAYLWSVEDM